MNPDRVKTPTGDSRHSYDLNPGLSDSNLDTEVETRHPFKTLKI